MTVGCRDGNTKKTNRCRNGSVQARQGMQRLMSSVQLSFMHDILQVGIVCFGSNTEAEHTPICIQNNVTYLNVSYHNNHNLHTLDNRLSSSMELHVELL